MGDPIDLLAQRLFERAMELPAQARRAFLQSKCARDATLLVRVAQLLAAAGDTQFQQPLDAEPVEPAATEVAAPVPPPRPATRAMAEGPGTRIGPYELLQKLGEGGFGAVFLAQQKEPVARQVALKIIKLGMDTHQVVARFEQERQALALMDHPHIAKVLDAGATDTGRPFFVMELCRGEPIVDYCDKNRLTLRDRLQLFVQVCQAVQHAHSKGIIHRDLKPSNVLVGVQDGAPAVKVIDFGIAKATSKLTDRTLFTEAEQVIGTPHYMSPEQAAGSLDIDTRTDVYSLGVVLYELLTGSTPFDLALTGPAVYSELQRLIRDTEPNKPSTRIGSSRQGLAQLAMQRRVEPRRLGAMVRGELDWIVMKAIEKDRTRRYETANGLGLDVQRYLLGEPVLAAPPSAAYRLRKVLRRHRAAVVAAMAIAAALLVGVLAFAWQAQEARRQRDHAIAAQRLEEVARRRAEDVAGLMESMFAGIDPNAEQETGLSLREQLVGRLDGLSSQLAGREGDPLTVARLQHALGQTFVALTEHAKAADLLHEALAIRTRELGLTAAETQSTIGVLAGALVQIGRTDEAATLVRSLPEGAQHQDGSLMLGMVYRAAERTEEAIAMLEAVRARLQAEAAPDTVDALVALHSLAACYREVGRIRDAIALFEDVQRRRVALLGPDHQDTLVTQNSLAVALTTVGRGQEAIALLEDLRARYRRRFEPGHLSMIGADANFAAALGQVGRHDEAIDVLRQVVERAELRLAPDHPKLLHVLRLLSRQLLTVGRVDEALGLVQPALVRVQRVAGADSVAADDCTLELARCRAAQNRYGDALGLAMPALERLQRRLGAEAPATLALRQLVAGWQRNSGQVEVATATMTEVVAARKRRSGEDSPETLDALFLLACCLYSADRAKEALPIFASVLEQQTALLGAEASDTLQTQRNLGAAHWALGHYDQAIPLLQRTLAAMERRLGAEHERTLATASDLASNLADAKRDEELFVHLQRWLLPMIRNARAADRSAGPLPQVFVELCRRFGAPELALPVLDWMLPALRDKLGADHPAVLQVGSDLGVASWFAGDLDKSIAVLEDVVARSRATLGENHPRTVERIVSLAVSRRDKGRKEEALAALEEVLARVQSGKVPPPANLDFWRRELVRSRFAMGQHDAARSLVKDIVAESRQATGSNRMAFAAGLASLGVALAEADLFVDAEPLLRECVELRTAAQPTVWSTYFAQAMLGWTLHGLQRDAEARPLLLQGCAGLRDAEASIPHGGRKRLPQVVDLLLRFCDDVGDAATAGPWRQWREQQRLGVPR